jgi:hypothetical protein
VGGGSKLKNVLGVRLIIEGETMDIEGDRYRWWTLFALLTTW